MTDLNTILERLRDFRQGRGKETPFLNGWLDAGGVGSGYLRDRYQQLGENINAGNRPFLGALRDHSNALLMGGAGISSGQRGAFGPAFAQGAQIDQQNADYRRQLAAQQAQQDALTQLTSQAPPLIGQAAAAGIYEPLGNWLTQQTTAPVSPDWETFTGPNGYTGRRNRITGEIAWDPEYMQPEGTNGPPEIIDGIGDNGQTIKLVYAPEHPNANEFGFVQMGGERLPSGMTVTLPDGTVISQGAQGGGTPTAQERQAAALYATSAADYEIVRSNFDELANLANQGADMVPLLGNFLVSEGYQRALNATMNILQNFLVVTSGQAVTEQEAERRARQVLPAPGDNPGTLVDKQRRIQDWITAIQNAGGRALQGGGAASPTTPFGETQAPAGYGGGAPTFGWPGQQAPPLIGQPQTQQEPASIPANEVTPADVQATVQEWIRAGLSEEQALQAISNRTGIPLQQLQQMLRTQ